MKKSKKKPVGYGYPKPKKVYEPEFEWIKYCPPDEKDPQKQYEALLNHHGNKMLFTEVTIPATYAEMLRMFNPPCKIVSPGCANCQAWDQWTRTQTVTLAFTRNEIIAQTINELWRTQ